MKAGPAPRGKVFATDKSAADLAGWMTDAGFAVDILDAAGRVVRRNICATASLPKPG